MRTSYLFFLCFFFNIRQPCFCPKWLAKTDCRAWLFFKNSGSTRRRTGFGSVRQFWFSGRPAFFGHGRPALGQVDPARTAAERDIYEWAGVFAGRSAGGRNLRGLDPKWRTRIPRDFLFKPVGRPVEHNLFGFRPSPF